MKLSRSLRVASAAVITGAILGLCALAPASATTTTTTAWGSWTFDEQNTYEGDITFGHASMPNAHWIPSVDETVANRATLSVLDTATEDEYFAADTPIGAVAGANGPTGSFNFLKDKINGLAGSVVSGVHQDMNQIMIRFTTPVPAGQLLFAASDIDSDHVAILGKDANGTFLTADELRGTASTSLNGLAFNYCASSAAPGSCTDTATPAMTTDSDGRIIATGQVANTTGSSVWVRPSVAVKELWVTVTNDDASNPSSIRLWVAQVASTTTTDAATPTQTLPNTGSKPLLVPGILAGLLALSGAGFMVSRALQPAGARRGRKSTR